MNRDQWKRLIISGGVLAGLVLVTAAAPAAVLPDDEEHGAVLEEQAAGQVKVQEISTDDEARVKVKVIGGADGQPGVIQWVGSPAKRGYLGVTLNPLSPELRKHFGAPQDRGVMVGSVVDGSPAQTAGIQVGDLITAIDGTGVAAASDVQRLIREMQEGETVSIALVRGGAPMAVEAAVGKKEMQEFDIGLLGDIGDLKKKAFFISSGMAGGNMVFKSVDGDVTVDLDEQPEKLEDLFIQKIGDSDDLIYFDTETFNESMKGVHEYLASPEFQEKLKALRERETELQQRLEELELKLEKLEKVHEKQ